MSDYTKIYYFIGHVVQIYDTAPDVVTRVSEIVFGSEYQFYGWNTYNFSDDKIYLGGTKSDVWTAFVFDPRTGTIVREFPGLSFWDVQGDTFWGYGSGDTTLARDTETGAVVFTYTDDTIGYNPGIDSLYMIQQALPGRRVLTYHYDEPLNQMIASVLHVTGPTSYEILQSVPLSNECSWADDEDLGYARPYIATGNKIWLRAGAYDSGILGAILTIDTGELVYVYHDPGNDESGDSSPYWDIGSNKLTQIGYRGTSTCLMVVDIDTASIWGRAGGGADPNSSYQFYQGERLVGFDRALVTNYGDGALGSFPYDALGLATESVLVSDTYSTPIGGGFGTGDSYPIMNGAGTVCVPPGGGPKFWTEYVLTVETS